MEDRKSPLRLLFPFRRVDYSTFIDMEKSAMREKVRPENQENESIYIEYKEKGALSSMSLAR